MDASATRAVWDAITTSGAAAWMIPGGFTLGGPSGNQPVGFNPAAVRDSLLSAIQPLKRGMVTMGGLQAPLTHSQAATYVKIYSDAIDAYNAAVPAWQDIDKAEYGFQAAMATALPVASPGFHVDITQRQFARLDSTPATTRLKWLLGIAAVGAIVAVIALRGR